MIDPIEAAVLALDAEFDKDPDNDPSSHQLVRAAIAAYTKAVSGEALAYAFQNHLNDIRNGHSGVYRGALATGPMFEYTVPLFAAPPLPADRVKPLAWKLGSDGETWIADTIVGTYKTWMPIAGRYHRYGWKGCLLLPESKSAIEGWKDKAQADYETRILSALEIARLPAVPDGWKLVPVEPTKNMIDATSPAHEGEAIIAKVMYRAMLAAAPEPEAK